MRTTQVYVGTYTTAASRGIYGLQFDPVRKALSAPVLMAEADNPTFLAWHPARPVLYATSETNTFGPNGTGAVLAFDALPDGRLRLINQVSSEGPGACFVAVHPAGRHVLVANYAGGNVAVLPIREDGGLSSASSVMAHQGAGPHPVRQPGPRAHAIVASPDGRYVVAADLGADRLFVYRFDEVSSSLKAAESGAIATAPGAGPRHLAWHPFVPLLYVVNELDSTVCTYGWDDRHGRLDLRGTASTLPAGWAGDNTTAELTVHPSGRFLYASNRGHDSLACFALDAADGIGCVEIIASEGRTPRHFALDHLGDHLVVANEESDALVLFAVHQVTGALAATGARAAVPSPACVLMPQLTGQ
jgi:6-phosphogluconolactonase